MAEQGFTISSPAFTHGGPIPNQYSKEGSNDVPPLQWMHPPENVQSYALIMEDPDAPGGLFTHWVVSDIPATTDHIDRGEEPGLQGRNDFQEIGYGGPLPPPKHGKHRYFIRLHALDIKNVPLKRGMTRAELLQAIDSHVLDSTEIMGTYER